MQAGGPLPAEREAVIREIIESPHLGRLLQDPYANYVMQSTLMVTQVRRLNTALLCSVYCKKHRLSPTCKPQTRWVALMWAWCVQ